MAIAAPLPVLPLPALTPWSLASFAPSPGYLDKDKATGWDIAAMSDMNWDFGGSCGRCIEVRCDPSTFSDYYGETFDRTGVCRDAGASVIVQVRRRARWRRGWLRGGR